MKTVIILGAGSSRAAGGNRPKKKTPPLDRDFFEIAESIDSVSVKKIRLCLEGLVGDYATYLMKSLEEVTTYLYIKALDAKGGSEYHKTLIELLQLLNKTLAKTTNDIKLGPRSLLYRFFLSELERVEKPEDLSIITLNYDLLIERTLEELAARRGKNVFAFPGCYRLDKNVSLTGVNRYIKFKNKDKNFTGISVLKLHGSMNWQSRHRSRVPTSKSMFRRDREIHVIDCPRIPTSLTWKREKRRVYMKPIIVPPVSGKREILHSDMLSVWDQAAKALRVANRVVIAGYSCPPLDIETRILLSENLRANKNARLYVIDPNAEVASKFVEVCGVSHATIYDTINNWVDDAKKYPS